jgi:hypothetical protein
MFPHTGLTDTVQSCTVRLRYRAAVVKSWSVYRNSYTVCTLFNIYKYTPDTHVTGSTPTEVECGAGGRACRATLRRGCSYKNDRPRRARGQVVATRPDHGQHNLDPPMAPRASHSRSLRPFGLRHALPLVTMIGRAALCGHRKQPVTANLACDPMLLGITPYSCSRAGSARGAISSAITTCGGVCL